jgi:hypothetical protein
VAVFPAGQLTLQFGSVAQLVQILPGHHESLPPPQAEIVSSATSANAWTILFMGPPPDPTNVGRPDGAGQTAAGTEAT